MANEFQSFVNCLRRIEVTYGRDGFHGDAYVEPHVYAIHRINGRLAPSRLGIPSHCWKNPPGPVLSALADVLPRGGEEALAPFRMAEWVGLAFAHEAWALSSDVTPDEEMLSASEHRLIYAHPDRYEIRLVYGVTREQERALVVRLATDNQQRVEDTHNSGAIPDGLVKLVATIDELLDA